jgi:hypothetical protein
LILRPFLLAASLFLLAAPAGAQAPAGEVPEALVDQFFAALPHPDEWKAHTGPNPTEVARIAALNPGREAEVRALLTDHARCFDPVAEAATRRGLRTIARRLGPDKLRQLIALYGSEEFRRFDSLGTRKEKGETISPAEEKEGERFLADHPVAIEFALAVQNGGSILTSDEVFMKDAQACAEVTRAAFDKAKLRRN